MGQNASCPRVLIIDDDGWMRSVAGSLLQEEGYTVASAGDGRAGLLLARQLRPDAVLLDLDLPGMPGANVLRSLKADPATSVIPIVVITGQPWQLDPHDVALCAAVLSKPFDLDHLLQTLGPRQSETHPGARNTSVPPLAS